MKKYLDGSYGTGGDIMNEIQNSDKFVFKFWKIEEGEYSNKTYFFKWYFESEYNQNGFITIILNNNNEISNSSLIATNDNCINKIPRPLGLYNDETLYKAFEHMMKDQNIHINGIYDSNAQYY